MTVSRRVGFAITSISARSPNSSFVPSRSLRVETRVSSWKGQRFISGTGITVHSGLFDSTDQILAQIAMAGTTPRESTARPGVFAETLSDKTPRKRNGMGVSDQATAGNWGVGRPDTVCDITPHPRLFVEPLKFLSRESRV